MKLINDSEFMNQADAIIKSVMQDIQRLKQFDTVKEKYITIERIMHPFLSEYHKELHQDNNSSAALYSNLAMRYFSMLRAVGAYRNAYKTHIERRAK